MAENAVAFNGEKSPVVEYAGIIVETLWKFVK